MTPFMSSSQTASLGYHEANDFVYFIACVNNIPLRLFSLPSRCPVRPSEASLDRLNPSSSISSLTTKATSNVIQKKSPLASLAKKKPRKPISKTPAIKKVRTVTKKNRKKKEALIKTEQTPQPISQQYIQSPHILISTPSSFTITNNKVGLGRGESFKDGLQNPGTGRQPEKPTHRLPEDDIWSNFTKEDFQPKRQAGRRKLHGS